MVERRHRAENMGCWWVILKATTLSLLFALLDLVFWVYVAFRYKREEEEEKKSPLGICILMDAAVVTIEQVLCPFWSGVLRIYNAQTRREENNEESSGYLYTDGRSRRKHTIEINPFLVHMLFHLEREVGHDWTSGSFENSVSWVFYKEIRRRLPHRTMHMYSGAQQMQTSAWLLCILVWCAWLLNLKKQVPDMV